MYIMEARRYNKLIVLTMLLVTLLFVQAARSDQYWTLSKGEELELDKQLALINKPGIKSFKTEDGDIFDCVDIYKQHAFDHPLLNNHTIQMRPTSVPKWVKNKASTNVTSSSVLLNNIECPQGTVCVRRIKREDLILAMKAKPLRFDNAGGGHQSAGLGFISDLSGASGQINLWSPVISRDQYSLAGMWLQNGQQDKMEAIQAGWIVNPSLYGDVTQPRLFTYWTADGYQKTGCYNTLCPGFVQVSTTTPPGARVTPVSTYNGQQYSIPISIYQDVETGNWWLDHNNEHLGYWPKTLFTKLAHSASNVAWGGQAYSPVSKKGPPMGSGHFAEEEFGRAAFVCGIKAIRLTGEGHKVFDPPGSATELFATKPQCYNAIKGIQKSKDPWIVSTFFGGPGC